MFWETVLNIVVSDVSFFVD